MFNPARAYITRTAPTRTVSKFENHFFSGYIHSDRQEKAYTTNPTFRAPWQNSEGGGRVIDATRAHQSRKWR